VGTLAYPTRGFFQCGEADIGDGCKQLALERVGDVTSVDELFESGLVEAFGCGNLGAGGVVGVECSGSWIGWDVERCVRGDNAVGGVGENETEMAMVSTSSLIGGNEGGISLETAFKGTKGCIIGRVFDGHSSFGEICEDGVDVGDTCRCHCSLMISRKRLKGVL
jgi:hypothetical protein